MTLREIYDKRWEEARNWGGSDKLFILVPHREWHEFLKFLSKNELDVYVDIRTPTRPRVMGIPVLMQDSIDSWKMVKEVSWDTL